MYLFIYLTLEIKVQREFSFIYLKGKKKKALIKMLRSIIHVILSRQNKKLPFFYLLKTYRKPARDVATSSLLVSELQTIKASC